MNRLLRIQPCSKSANFCHIIRESVELTKEELLFAEDANCDKVDEKDEDPSLDDYETLK